MTVKFDENTTIVVFGASGDLAKKKTFPALFGLYREKKLAKSTKIIGFARSKLSDEELRVRIEPFLSYDKSNEEHKTAVVEFLNMCTYFSGPYDDGSAFEKFETHLKEIEHSSDPKRLFYLALPPSVFTSVCTNIKKHNYPSNGNIRIIVEKPFGHDLNSSRELQKNLAPLFKESELYRIDHYLGKEMVKNLLPFRFSNIFLGSCWNNKFIDSIQITFKEPFGTEGRGGYFDNIGIIRDVIQNHLLQVLTLLLMEKPSDDYNSESIRDEKVKLLKAIDPINFDDILIGQYDKSLDGKKPSYLDDETVNPDSKAVTYAAIKLNINNETWNNVPVILKAGKALNEGKVEIRIQFKEMGGIFKNSARNELVIRIQPDEAMYIKMNIKVPGESNKVSLSELDLTYKDRYSKDFYIPQAYESLIHDCLMGDHSNFVRDDELDVSWQLFTPLLEYLESKDAPTPTKYPYGSRGPAGLYEFMEKNGYVYEPIEKYQWPLTTPELLKPSKF